MIRPARPGDVPAVVALVRELADFERAAHEVRLTEDGLGSSLFGADPKVFAHVAEVSGAVVGMAVWFLSYSTWRGAHGVHLEDLYVQPAHRRRGLGRALVQALADEAVRRGCTRVEWSVLDWNTPAVEFYRSLGAVPMDEWTVWRLTDAALTAAASPGR